MQKDSKMPSFYGNSQPDIPLDQNVVVLGQTTIRRRLTFALPL